MRRSASMSGASVVLELLPKSIECTPSSVIKALVRAGSGDAVGADCVSLADLDLVNGDVSVSLRPIASHIDAGLSGTGAASYAADLAAGRFPQVLGHILADIAAARETTPEQIYTAALCLATLVHNAEAFALISVLDGGACDHPAILALRGYLAFQCRQEELGRKLLARSALLSRSNPAHRPVLHFTQHVLLAHQFGA